ncbi:MAG: hypothetical protein JW991_05365 [Candidatus Pacebacteria bacterium]|nr:hypothetical protein [Candidatus Paceibacterota bacterium]
MIQARKRRELAKKRKNFFPALIIALVCWSIWLLVFFKLAPGSALAFLVFYFSLLGSLFFSFSLISGSSRHGLFISGGIIAFLLLRQVDLANYFNLVSLGVFLIALEVYLFYRDKS